MSIFGVVMVILIFVVGAIVCAILYFSRKDVHIMEELPENATLVLDFSDKKGYFLYLKLGENQVGNNKSMLKLKPVLFRTKDREITKEKLALTFDVLIDDSTYDPLGTSFGTEREIALIYPKDWNKMNKVIKKTVLGKMIMHFLDSKAVWKEEAHLLSQKLEAIDLALDMLEKGTLANEEFIRRAKSIVVVDQDGRKKGVEEDGKK